MDIHEWIDYGIKRGWCTPVYCDTHDSMELTDLEAQQWDDGEDPCIPVIRIWEDNA
jgi:hypothetical protein